MSDYLWDKTGEADKDVKRLEGLLGEFRHRPRALELPAEVGGHDISQFRAPRLFRPAWLAVAAALLLVVLAGALFVLRRGAAGGDERREQNQAATRDQQSAPRQDAPRQAPSSLVVEPGNDKTAPGVDQVAKRNERNGADVRDEQIGKGGRALKDESSARQAVSRKPEGLQDGGGVASKRRGGVTSAAFSPKERDGDAGGATPRAVGESAPLEGRRLEERRRLAKDDLMYALRLTGIKLKEVQRKAQKVDGWKSAFDEQKPKQVTGKP